MRAQPIFAAADYDSDIAVLPVWRRIALQLLGISALCLAVVLATELLSLDIAPPLRPWLSLGLVVAPVLLWLLLSALPESRAPRPRRRLMGVAVLSGLCAAAIGLPLVKEFFLIDQWLPLGSVIERIIGYTLTVGIVDTGIKFVILRYLALPQAFRVRSDVIAYAMAAAVGYSFYISLAQVWRLEPVWELAAILVMSNVVAQFASSMALTLGFADMYFSDAFPSVLPLSLLAGALAIGLIAPQEAGLTSGPLSTEGNTTRTLFGLSFLLAALLLTLAISYFLHSNAERRQRETYRGRSGDGAA